ncbi:MAG TPA: hydantoinase B/oxoprolinase family protein [Planctomycetaceae bacterium]|nr:hydantoinase B/oxoprolinase family protein [Planctomycetaceae bacterium]
MSADLDPVTLTLVQKRVDYIAQRMGQVMLKTARSPIFTQSHDFSCFITDGRGRLISQADGIPIHTGGGGMIVAAILRDFTDISPGDVFISSDPYVAGGNHLPDWVISRPLFTEGKLFAFLCNRAHQSDIGGGVAGTYNPAATEIFHEGIRLPALRLIERGQLRHDLWKLLLLNSRCPDLLDGDLKAMLGSTEVGAEEILSLARDLGAAECDRYIEGILSYAERRMRSALSELPDGTFHGEEMTDNDCFEAKEVWIRVKITKTGDSISFDYADSDPQMKGFKNSSLSNTTSATYVALTSFLDPDIPRNDGTYRCVDVNAPLGSVVNPRPPAPLTMCTVLPSHEIIHACWKALANLAPERACAGWGKISHCNMAGPTATGSTYVMYHWGALPAAGAVRGRDGFDQIGPLNSLGNLIVPNCETYEHLYPVHFVQHELRCDSAGPGQFRGGTGAVYRAVVEDEAEFAFRGEGQRTPSGFGALGGGIGAAGSVRFEFPDGRVWEPPQFGAGRVGPAALTIHSPAGGGWGNPFSRDPDLVFQDVRDGLLSREKAAEDYGVILTPDSRAVDYSKTADTRRQQCS